jgi:hypothetical protein
MLNVNKLRLTCEYASGKRTFCIFHEKKVGGCKKIEEQLFPTEETGTRRQILDKETISFFEFKR